jgi:AcrR family transcriptional regulator
LLAAALDEFAAKGFAGARVGDIAERAGVAKQLINYYFDSKQGLYLELQRTWLRREEAFADPELPLDELALRYLHDVLSDPRSMRLLIWRGLADPPERPPDETPERQDLSGMRRRQAEGELAAGLDPGYVLLALMGLVAAPVAMPHMVKRIVGVDPDSAEFEARYSEQLRLILARLSENPDWDHAKTGALDAANE